MAGNAGSRAEMLASILSSRNAILKGDFVLSSGRRSNIYIDVRRLLGDPNSYNKVVDLMVEAWSDILTGPTSIIGVATGGIAWAALLASRLSKPLGYVRPRAKEYGTGSAVEGAPPRGRAVVVDDVATTGSSLSRAVKLLRDEGFAVEHALVIVDRGEGAGEKLKDLGVELHSIASLEDLILALGWGRG